MCICSDSDLVYYSCFDWITTNAPEESGVIAKTKDIALSEILNTQWLFHQVHLADDKLPQLNTVVNPALKITSEAVNFKLLSTPIFSSTRRRRMVLVRLSEVKENVTKILRQRKHVIIVNYFNKEA